MSDYEYAFCLLLIGIIGTVPISVIDTQKLINERLEHVAENLEKNGVSKEIIEKSFDWDFVHTGNCKVYPQCQTLWDVWKFLFKK